MTMTSNDAVKAAGQYLSELRHTGRFGARIPETCRPQTFEDALAIQDRIVRVQGVAVGGYKCSLPAAGRDVSRAPIFAPTIGATSPRFVRPAVPGAVETARIEPEVAFVLGRDLPARGSPHRDYGEDEVRDAIAETRFVLELLGSRYTDPTQLPFVEVVADCVSNQGLHLGPLVPNGLAASLMSFPVRIESASGANEFRVDRDGRHPDGHPLKPLVWLANHLAARGDALRAGQVVTTGSYCGMIDVPLATPLVVTFGDMGKIEVEFRQLD